MFWGKETTQKCVMNHSRALEGVHGVQVAPHSPFDFTEANQSGDFCTSNGVENRLQRLWQQRPACLRPVHCSISCHGDQHVAETVANVVTSIPFIVLGIHAPRKNLNSKLYANSLIGVGVASSMYHCSRGRLRKFLRWVDYTMIAATSVCLSIALRNESSKLLTAASAICLPVNPMMVSVLHTGMMEVAFARRASKDPDLRMAHTLHKMSTLVGASFFIADDLFPKTPYLHAAWHLAAAVGVGTCNKLLE
ncbi:hypothetical protein Fmac_001651 [Flemingia macrophylla]|uniref:Uncharacterized protein n=1 Tax=Flemingia macrophylla TaxID=520843 RepID=A0ABD1NHQ1_9FABA